jgi:predicted nucleotidyltransferase
MNQTENTPINEGAEKTKYLTPVVESFFDDQAMLQTWPENITRNEDFRSQIEARKKLQQCLDRICNRLPNPDITLESGIETGIITENEVVELYNSLITTLESGQDYERILLYLPFEFLPASTWQPKTQELEQTIERFKSTYVKTWRSLLTAHDVRANFVDGDVPEMDLREGELIRVVKAAHLLPALAQKGLIRVSEILDLVSKTEDPLLKQNIGEALYVMSDLSLITESEVPGDLPVIKHTKGPRITTEGRKKWLMEKQIQESNPPLEEPAVGAEKLKGPFSKNLDLLDDEILKIREAIDFIKTDPELSKLVYPVVMLSGSRLKGYGTKESDIDIGIFVRPDVSPEERSSLQAKVKEIFSVVNNLSQPVEFWLKEANGLLEINNLSDNDPLLGENFQTQFLFGSAWEGDLDVIRYLREKLLTKYFYETDEKIHGQEARKLYLGELERDTLQYRLMHKGYKRFFPLHGGISTPHSDKIDSKSMFWDSGYRQLATRLFADRVFLPKLSTTKK